MTIAFRSVVMGTAALAGLALVRPAYADTVSAQQLSLLDQFNAIVLGNLTDSSDIEGRAFVGGNANGTFNVGTPGDIAASPQGYNTLIVDGSVGANGGSVQIGQGGFTVGGSASNITTNGSTGSTSTVAGNVSNVTLNGGALQYGGTTSGNFNLNGGASAAKVSGLSANPVPATSTFGTLSTLSTTLAGLTATGSVAMNGNVATFTAAAGASGTAVFDVNATLAALIFSAANFQFDLGSATSAIINVVDDGSITDNTNFIGNDVQTYASDLLWNFVGATNLAFDREFAGTVLATDADVTNSSPIDGTLVAKDATLGSELHSHPYTGNLPDGGTPATPVPEPGSVALVAAGLGMLAVLRRRRVL